MGIYDALRNRPQPSEPFLDPLTPFLSTCLPKNNKIDYISSILLLLTFHCSTILKQLDLDT